MQRWCLAMIALLGACDDDPLERLDPPKKRAPSLAPELPRPPPPPPPPPDPQSVEPPVEITSFLAEAASAPGPWRVTINELADSGAAKGRRFLGYRVTGARTLAQPLADALVARLGVATSYVDGDVGCDGRPMGIVVARGSLAINFVEDCGHVYLTEQGHEGRWALFSSDMTTFVDGLRER